MRNLPQKDADALSEARRLLTEVLCDLGSVPNPLYDKISEARALVREAMS